MRTVASIPSPQPCKYATSRWLFCQFHDSYHCNRSVYTVKFILIITPELINTHSPKNCWQYYFGLVPPYYIINMGGHPLLNNTLLEHPNSWDSKTSGKPMDSKRFSYSIHLNPSKSHESPSKSPESHVWFCCPLFRGENMWRPSHGSGPSGGKFAL